MEEIKRHLRDFIGANTWEELCREWLLRAIGGGARSKSWLQVKADITGIPVVTPKMTEAAGLGAALLAGAGAGLFSSAAEAANRLLQLTDPCHPDPARQAAYARQYELYRRVYPAIAPITHRP